MPRILIVSESLAAVERLKSALTAEGFHVLVTASMDESDQKLPLEGIDLLLSYLTPPAKGFFLCQRIKADPKSRLLPVVILLDHAEPEQIRHGLEVGADGFLTEEDDPLAMARGVERFFSRTRVQPDEPHPPGLSGNLQGLREELLDAYQRYARLKERFDLELNQRTRAEEEAKRSRQRFELAVLGSGDGIWDWDLSTDEVYFSPRWKSMLGHTDGEVRNHLDEWKSRLHPEDRERALESLRCYFEGVAPAYELEHRLRHKDGSYRWILARGVALRDPTGKPHRMSGSHTDITEQKKSAELLARESDLLVTLMDHLPAAIYFKDRDSRFVRVNRSMAAGFGFSHPDQTIGKSDFDFFDRAHAEPALRDEQEILLTGKPMIAHEEKEVWPDGTQTWVLTNKMPWQDRDGNIVGTFGISYDITKRKLAEEAFRKAEAQTRLLLESSSEGIFGMDLSGAITFVNPSALEMLGYTSEEVLGHNSYDLVHYKYADGSPYRVEDCPIFRAFQTGRGCCVDDEVFWRRDGTFFSVEYTSSPLRFEGEGIQGAVVIFTDITDRKRNEIEVRKAKEDAVAANKAKSEFLANMSHEIRTPMNAIIGMSELLRDTALAPEQREYLEMVRQSADALLGLINDILDFSKIEAGRLDLDSTDFSLQEVLGDTLHTLSLRAYQKGLELISRVAPNVPDNLTGDPGRLRQVIMNLVGNALKFTDQGEVVVEVEWIESTLDPRIALHFTVHDTGIGIPREKQSLIFAAFSQADSSTTRRFGGTGLGLTISSRLVEIMGGRIWVESEVGEGSTFHFTSQFDRSSSELPDRSAEILDKVRGLRVLIVDDNATNRRILEETLSLWGMRPTLAEGGIPALGLLDQAQAQHDLFHLILLDAHMPGMDGFELAGKILNRPETASTPVLILTSGGQPGDVARCQQLGLAAFLTKPIKQTDLRRALLKALNREPSEKQLAPVAPSVPLTVRSLRILLAEDNLMNQKLATRLLEKQGHTVVVAENGKKALAALGFSESASVPIQKLDTPFDLVLMDVQMPELDGLETTLLIREREKSTGTHLPIIAMTAHAMKGDDQRCLRAGMDAYLAKPIKADDLFAMIGNLMGRPAEPSPASSSSEESIDWKEALASVRGDVELLRELAEIFLHECPRWLLCLREGLDRGDASLVSRTAHTLKGSLGTFAAKSAHRAALELENRGRENRLEDASGVLSNLEQTLAIVVPMLESFSKGNLPIHS